MSNRWWLLPQEDCFNNPRIPLHVVYKGDDGSCWEFAVQSIPGAPCFRWHHQEGRPIWPETQRIPEALRPSIAQLCQAVGQHIVPPEAGTLDRTILDAVADAVSDVDFVSGKRIRAAMLHVSNEQFRDAVLRLQPRFLRSNDYDPHDGLDSYDPTFTGLIHSKRGQCVDKIVQTLLELFREKFSQNPDFSKFTLDEVFDRGGFAPKEKPFIKFVIGSARFGDGGGGSFTEGAPEKTKYNWNTPPWIERLIRFSTTKGYLAYLRAGSKQLPSPTSPSMLTLGDRNRIEGSMLQNLQTANVPAPVLTKNGEIMKRQLFISHSAKDAQLARLLVLLIEGSFVVPDEGIRCTSADGYALAPGEPSDEVLKSNIKECALLIALLTRDSLLSVWVSMELGAAWILDKPTCAILAPDVNFREIQGPLSKNHAIRVEHPASLANLLSVIEKQTGWTKRNAAKSTSALNEFVEQVKALLLASPAN